MGEAVYEYGNDGLMKAADKTIDAKGSTYTLTKAFKDGNTTTYQVVERGQEVPFTITAVFLLKVMIKMQQIEHSRLLTNLKE